MRRIGVIKVMSYKLRMRFSKTGTAKYISHLDLISTMIRVMRRAGIELKYSEGFNPHPYLSVALPLPVGCGSTCELMDFGTLHELLPDGLPEIINAVMPEGLYVQEIYPPESRFSDVAWVETAITLHYGAADLHRVSEGLYRRFTAGIMNIRKKTKRGLSELDIAPFIRDIEISCSDVVLLTAKLSAQNPSVTPENLLSLLDTAEPGLFPDFSSFCRTQVFDCNLRVFR